MIPPAGIYSSAWVCDGILQELRVIYFRRQAHIYGTDDFAGTQIRRTFTNAQICSLKGKKFLF
jgi:hypothetical protein